MNKLFATVSLNSLLAHDPCDDGLHNFKIKFGHLGPDTPVPLLSCLESNSAKDVIWALRAVQQNISDVIPLIAADFAESVLHIFEEKFPGDDRPRKAIEAARSGGLEKGDAAQAAADAAYAAYATRTSRVTRATAADAAYAAYHATRACADAAAAAYAAYDAYAASHYAAKRNKEKEAEILRKYLTDKE